MKAAAISCVGTMVRRPLRFSAWKASIVCEPGSPNTYSAPSARNVAQSWSPAVRAISASGESTKPGGGLVDAAPQERHRIPQRKDHVLASEPGSHAVEQ